MRRVLGVDFGTTNSVVSEMTADGSVTSRRFSIGLKHFETFRTVLCFWNESGLTRHAAGPAAVEAYLDDPGDSRLIMSMKSYLAQRSFTQTRVFGRIFTLEDMIALFLRALLGEPEPGTHIIAGRPVRFAGEFADDEFGAARLRDAYAKAGFTSVDLALEPEAAGYKFIRALTAPANVLVGDFGGGTSDFSLIRFTPGAAQPIEALGHGGLGLAGDTFDYRIIDNAISPLLGKGSTYKVLGGEMPIPLHYYAGFARWHQLSLMRAPRTLRDMEEVARTATQPEQLHHLIKIIEDELGYQLYQVVSSVKAALSSADSARLQFEYDGLVIDREIHRAEFESWIAPDLARIATAVDDVLAQASMTPAQVDRVFLTGGTSFVPAVQRVFRERFGAEKLSSGGEFVSVSEGLALIGADRAG
jgi:hypothetical chaperone protein